MKRTIDENYDSFSENALQEYSWFGEDWHCDYEDKLFSYDICGLVNEDYESKDFDLFCKEFDKMFKPVFTKLWNELIDKI